MATTNFDQLDELAGNVFFRNCNQAELDGDHTFYGEDLARLIEDQQPDAKGVKKFVASFWGVTHVVWMAVDATDAAIQGLVALACPPYYPGPNNTYDIHQGDELDKNNQPVNWPPPGW